MPIAGSDSKDYKVNVRFGLDNKQFIDGLSKAENNLKSFARGLTVMSGALLAMGAASINAALSFNKGMANVATLIPGNIERVKELKKGVMDLAESTGQSSIMITRGLYQVISAFSDTGDTLAQLDINARMAAAGLATVEDAIALTSAVTKGYGDTSAAAMEKVADLSLLVVRLGQTTFPELAGSIGSVTPIAAALGISVEELMASFATATGVVGGASEVATGLKGAMNSLLKPSEEMAAAIDKVTTALGYSGVAEMVGALGLIGSLRALISTTDGSIEAIAGLIPNIRALPSILALTGGQADVFDQKLKDMSESAGTLDEAFLEMTDGINKAGFEWDKFKEEMKGIAITMGDNLLPVFQKVSEMLKPWIERLKEAIEDFSKLNTKQQEFRIGLGLIVIALPAVLNGFAKLLGSIRLITTAFMLAHAAAFGFWGVVALIAGGLGYAGYKGGKALGETMKGPPAGAYKKPVTPMGGARFGEEPLYQIPGGGLGTKQIVPGSGVADFFDRMGLKEPGMELPDFKRKAEEYRQKLIDAGLKAEVVTKTTNEIDDWLAELEKELAKIKDEEGGAAVDKKEIELTPFWQIYSDLTKGTIQLQAQLKFASRYLDREAIASSMQSIIGGYEIALSSYIALGDLTVEQQAIVDKLTNDYMLLRDSLDTFSEETDRLDEAAQAVADRARAIVDNVKAFADKIAAMKESAKTEALKRIQDDLRSIGVVVTTAFDNMVQAAYDLMFSQLTKLEQIQIKIKQLEARYAAATGEKPEFDTEEKKKEKFSWRTMKESFSWDQLFTDLADTFNQASYDLGRALTKGGNIGKNIEAVFQDLGKALGDYIGEQIGAQIGGAMGGPIGSFVGGLISGAIDLISGGKDRGSSPQNVIYTFVTNLDEFYRMGTSMPSSFVYSGRAGRFGADPHGRVLDYAFTGYENGAHFDY